MRFCGHCGKETGYESFCEHCGAPPVNAARQSRDPFNDNDWPPHNQPHGGNNNHNPPYYPQQDGYGQQPSRHRLQTPVGSYICAVIYPLILAGLCVLLYALGAAHWIGMMIGFVFAAATGAVIALGGFYLIIIPLPIIMFFKWGCVKPHLPLWQRILYGILCLALPAMMFGVLFLSGWIAGLV